MKLWDEWEYKTGDIEHDKDGNEIVRIELILTTNADRHDVVNAISDYLEEGLTREINQKRKDSCGNSPSLSPVVLVASIVSSMVGW